MVKGGYLDFNQISENDLNVANDISENPTKSADNRILSESSEDELIRAYVSIDRSKSADPETFEES